MADAFDWPAVVFSADIDWASEACIEDTFRFAHARDIKPCFFVTHDSAILNTLAVDDAVELGMHPNFLPGSTHGEDQNSVIETVMQLAPRARGFRSHCFVDSTPITRAFKSAGLTWDSNLCLYLQHGLVPMRHCSGLIRLPVFWADDVHMSLNPDMWEVDAFIEDFLSPGLKILDVHPIHLALNTPNLAYYDEHKRRSKAISMSEIRELRYAGQGTRTFLDELLARLSAADVRVYTFEEVISRGDYRVETAQIGRNDNLSIDDHKRYWSLSVDERQSTLRNMYNRRNPLDPYATSRDHNQRELEIGAIFRALPDPPLNTIMDLGCGNGHTLLSIVKSIDEVKAIGVDFSDQLIGGARQLAIQLEDQLKTQPEFICDDAIAFTEGISSDSIDCVITERFLLNLPDEQAQHAEILEIYRILRPAGRLLMCEGSRDGFFALNHLRASMGLKEIAETSADNLSSIRFDDREIERFVTEEAGFELVGKLGFSTYFAISRALYPRLISPQPPKFGARINTLAREIQEQLPLQPGLGSNVLWVLQKP